MTALSAGTSLRPRLHFAPERNWMNDPNGLVFHGARYHLYFQHNPNANDPGDMSWGHASSTDLVQWDEHPVALLHRDDEEIFSGSVVVDTGNTSGLALGDGDPLVALHTVASPRGQAQAVVWSEDGGFTWTEYGVVLDRGTSDFRDPKVLRIGDNWILVAVEALRREVHFFSSPDLLHWTPLSVFGPEGATDGIWECPDLFLLDGRWVLTVSVNPGGPAGGSGQQYFVGTFDGVRFEASSWGWLDRGHDFYAGVTFHSAPDEECVMIGWMSNWAYAALIPTQPWRGSMSLPRRLSLGADGRIRQEVAGGPWSGRRVFEQQDALLEEGRTVLPVEAWGSVLRLDAVLKPGSAERVGFIIRGSEDGTVGTVVAWSEGELSVDRSRSGESTFSPLFPSTARAPLDLDGPLHLSMWVDTSSIEVFAEGGALVMTEQIFPSSEDTLLAVFAEGGDAIVESLVITAFA